MKKNAGSGVKQMGQNVFRVWMRISERIGKIMTPLILTLVYLLLLTPYAWLIRCLGIKPLSFAFRDDRETCWVDKSERPATLQEYRRR